MSLKEKIGICILCATSYLLLPYLSLNFYSIEEMAKASFVILAITTFLSFAINIVITYLKGKYISLPIISSVVSIPLYFIFNASAIVLIVLVILMSFLGYFLGGIFTRTEEEK